MNEKSNSDLSASKKKSELLSSEEEKEDSSTSDEKENSSSTNEKEKSKSNEESKKYSSKETSMTSQSIIGNSSEIVDFSNCSSLNEIRCNQSEDKCEWKKYLNTCSKKISETKIAISITFTLSIRTNERNTVYFLYKNLPFIKYFILIYVNGRRIYRSLEEESIETGTNITVKVSEEAADKNGTINLSGMFKNSSALRIEVELLDKSEGKLINMSYFAADNPELKTLNIDKYANIIDGTGLVEGSDNVSSTLPSVLKNSSIYGTDSNITCKDGDKLIYIDSVYPIEGGYVSEQTCLDDDYITTLVICDSGIESEMECQTIIEKNNKYKAAFIAFLILFIFAFIGTCVLAFLLIKKRKNEYEKTPNSVNF